MYRYYLAHRFLVSRPINLLGIIGVMLGVWSLIVVVSIFDGYRVELRTQFTTATSDIVAYRLGRRANFARARKVIEADPNVAACSPRLIWQGLIHPRDEKELQTWLPGALQADGRFITVFGVDPTLESKTTNLAGWIAAGEDPALKVDVTTLQPGGDWALISTRKAKSKALQRDHVMTITTARTHYHRGGHTMQFLGTDFRVAGGYKTRHAGYDNLTVLVSIDKLREMIAGDNSQFVNEIAIKLLANDAVAVEETRTRLFHALRTLPEYELAPPRVQIAGEQSRGFIQSIEHQGGLMKLVLFVIMVVAAFLVYATLSMLVTEKTHDIGVLTALGGTRAGVLQVFMTTGFVISLAGTLLGLISGCLTSIYLNDFNEFLKASWFEIDLFPTAVYNLPGVPYYLDPTWIGIVVLSSLVLGLVVSILPAFRAMRNDPLQCLRDQ